MNLKRIIIAISVVVIGTGNINAQDMKTEVPKISDFPVGEENTGYAQYFTGKSWLAPLTTSKELNVPMSNVPDNSLYHLRQLVVVRLCDFASCCGNRAQT